MNIGDKNMKCEKQGYTYHWVNAILFFSCLFLGTPVICLENVYMPFGGDGDSEMLSRSSFDGLGDDESAADKQEKNPSKDLSDLRLASSVSPDINYNSSQYKISRVSDVGYFSGTSPDILVSPDGYAFVVGLRNCVACFSLKKGNPRILWAKCYLSTYGKYTKIESGGIVLDGRNLVFASANGTIYVIDSTTGNVILRKDLGLPFRGAPVVVGDNIIVKSLNGVVTAVSKSQGNVVWTQFGSSGDLALVDVVGLQSYKDTVVVPTGGNVELISASNGNSFISHDLRSRDIGTTGGASAVFRDIHGQMVVQDGVVYVSSYSGDSAAIDMDTGVARWQVPYGSIFDPVVSGDVMYVFTDRDEIYALNTSDGSVVWHVKIRKAIDTYLGIVNKGIKGAKRVIIRKRPNFRAMHITKNYLSVITKRGQVFVFNAFDGTLVDMTYLQYCKSFGRSCDIFGDPVVRNGSMFFVVNRHWLFALDGSK